MKRFSFILSLVHIKSCISTHRSVGPLLAAVLARPPPEMWRLPRALHVDAADDKDNGMTMIIIGFAYL